MNTLGRNDLCHCKSGKKYKKCCLEKDEIKYRKEREKVALNAAQVIAEKAEIESKESNKSESASAHQSNKPKEHPTNQGWVGKVADKMGFLQRFSHRKTGGGNKGG